MDKATNEYLEKRNQPPQNQADDNWEASVIGAMFLTFWRDHSAWSQETFGRDSVRGPEGPIKHLKKECDEVLAHPADHEEYADLMLLLCDAARRAKLTPYTLLEQAINKLAINRTRKWGKASNTEAVEHIRE